MKSQSVKVKGRTVPEGAFAFGNEATHPSVMWHVASVLPRLRRMNRDAVIAIGQEASAISEVNPLHMVDQRFAVAGYGENLTGFQVVALMVAVVWILCGESARVAAPLVAMYPDLPQFADLLGGNPFSPEPSPAQNSSIGGSLC